ncbi:MAG: NAD(P)-binding domain-containing protein [Planctomycetota bacterium]
MKVAFIGYGSMTRALAGRWAADHDLFIGGRDPDKAAALADDLGDGTAHGDSAAAVAFGEVVVLATPHAAALGVIEGVGPEAFAGKTLVDINNPVPGYADGDFTVATYAGKSLAEALADAAPGAHVVKAFNCCQAKVWEMDPPEFDGRRLVTPLCGDNPEAKQHVAQLIEALGSEPLDFGELKYAHQLECVAGLVIKLLFSSRDPHTVFNLIQPEVKPIA